MYKSNTIKDHNKLEEIPFENFRVIRLSKRWDIGIFKDARWIEESHEKVEQVEKVALLFPKENGRISKESDEILKLKNLNHINVIKFYGTTYDLENKTEMFVLQLTAESLCEYLTIDSHKFDQTEKLNIADKLNIAIDIATGLEHLHYNNIIHGDLHSRNIFIDKNKRALITNPQIFTVINKSSSMDLMRNKNKICYIDPRLLNSQKQQPDEHSDIYSLAIVMWRIFSDKEPFSDYENKLISLVHEILLQNKREEPTKDTPERYINVYKKCWSSNPKERLPFLKILSELNEYFVELNNWR
ncbi:kinase-like protein [Gigaspora margarita]|uniref:Kinase-like protein n=1 Tax=Gigaspora margarita TaxID=4874 RepID=A0A8H3XH09_GIGMA|nr:kinase-like protein [Gigaspora margarita]